MIYTNYYLDSDGGQNVIDKTVGAHFYHAEDPKNPENKVLKIDTHNTIFTLNSVTSVAATYATAEPSACDFDFSYYYEKLSWLYASKYFTLELRSKSGAKLYALRFELYDYTSGVSEAKKMCVKTEDGDSVEGVTLYADRWYDIRVRYYFGSRRGGARVRIYLCERGERMRLAADFPAPTAETAISRAAIVHSATKIKGISYFDNISFTLIGAKYSPDDPGLDYKCERRVYDFESGIPSTPEFNIEMLLKRGDERIAFDPSTWLPGGARNPFKSSHSFYEILLVISGNGKFFTEQKEFPMSPGSIFITAPGCKHSISVERGYKILSVAGNFDKLSFITDVSVLSDNIYNEGKRLAELIHYNRFGNEDYLESLCDAYIKYILTNLNYTFKNTTASIYKIIEKMEKNFGNCDLSVGKLLEESGYAKDYIRSEFLAVTKITPKKYLTNIRMKNAKTMLELYGNDMSIGEVAERCGIIDQSIFSRIFKKHFGVSPTDYKNNR